MDTQPNEETGDSRDERAPETTPEGSQSKLRDLRPEKDPMGASRGRLPKDGVENPS